MLAIYENSKFIGKRREKFFRRSGAEIEAVSADVKYWLERIRRQGDRAVLEYIRKFDNPGFKPGQFRVSRAGIRRAYRQTAPGLVKIIKKQIAIARAFHQEQARRVFKERSWQVENVPGVVTGVIKNPVDAAGLYVPAGKAPLPTVAQILTVAAKAARVPRVAVFYPATGEWPEIIVAADLAGADEIYRVGGIAAIAAMAYGTESIRRVEKIAGPGSPWVQAAKAQVVGQVGIDMISGPSEALILADESANPAWIAADILAKLEHGPDSACPVATTSRDLAGRIRAELKRQLRERMRQEYIRTALKNGYNGIILMDSRRELLSFANEYAAEHLQIQLRQPEKALAKIRNAGSIFVGGWSPVAAGDYATGTNHCLPTGRSVGFSSPVGVGTFIKTSEFQRLTRRGLRNLQPIVQGVAAVEGLDGHAQAVDIRLERGRG